MRIFRRGKFIQQRRARRLRRRVRGLRRTAWSSPSCSRSTARRCDRRAHRKHHLAPAALHRAVVHWHRPVLELRPQLHAAFGPRDPRLLALGPADPVGNRASRSAPEQAPWPAAMQRLASDINVDCSNLAALTGTVFVKRSALLPASTTLRRSTTPSTATACR
jgi:hypothetical protein